MEEKYQLVVNEKELKMIAAQRIGAASKKQMDQYFFLAAIATAVLAIVLIQSTHNAYMSLLGFAPLLAFYVYSVRLTRRINRQVSDYIAEVKSQNEA